MKPGRRWLAPALVLAVGLVAYAESLDAPFAWDDGVAIVDNPNVRRLWPLSVAVSAPPSAPVAGRPTTSLSLALNYALTGLDPRGFRAVNLAIHALAALTFFGVVRRTLALPRIASRLGGAADGTALACALLWLAHPLTSEAIGYLTQRSTSLMGLFLVLTLYCAIRAAGDGPRSRWSAAAVVACALGMGSKEVMVVAPLLVLLYDRAFLAGSFGAALRGRPGLHAGLAATWGVLAVALATGPDYHAMKMGYTLGVGPVDYLLTQAPAIAHYLRLAIWPSDQILDYGRYAPVPLARAAPPALLLMALLGASLLGSWKRPAAGFLGLWFFLTLAPTSSVMPIVGEVAAERRMYVPLMALAVAAVLGARWLLARRAVALRAGLAALAVAALAAATAARMREYRSAVSLWRTVVERAPHNPRGFLSYGNALRDAGLADEAQRQLERALALDPDYLEAHNNLATLHHRQGRLELAIAHYEAALRSEPRIGYVNANLARALLAADRPHEAVAHYRRELELQPVLVAAIRELAWLLATHPDAAVREPGEAVRLARRADELAGGDAPAVLDALAAAYAAAGRFEEAVAAAERALARASGRAPAVRARLERYRRGEPFVQDRAAAAPLAPRARVRRLGRARGSARFADATRPILGPPTGGRVSLPLRDLPASRVHFAAAPAEPAAPPAVCRVALEQGGDAREIARLALPAAPRWVETSAELPALASGRLLLECPAERAVAWAPPLAVPRAEPGAGAPLLVLLSLDTLRADHVSGFGAAPGATPQLERLGVEGLRHGAATAEGTSTLPSHFALFYSRLFGYPLDVRPPVSLAQALADGGFATLARTDGGFVGSAWNFHRGFDRYSEVLDGAGDLPRLLADALEDVRRHETAPTFLFVHSYAAHRQTPVERAWRERHGLERPFEPSDDEREAARALYQREVRRADADLAPFFDAMRAAAASRPVLAVVVSDHGEAFGEHGGFRHGAAGGSATLHDELIRVPLIAWGPAIVPPGRRLGRPTMLSDVAPSLLAAAGIAPPPGMRGANLWPVWAGRGAPPPTPGSVSTSERAWSLRAPDRKLIASLGDDDALRFALYDLHRDPAERADLAAERPAVVEALHAELLRALARAGARGDERVGGFAVCEFCRVGRNAAFWRHALAGEATPEAPAPDATTRARLRALGYAAPEPGGAR